MYFFKVKLENYQSKIAFSIKKRGYIAVASSSPVSEKTKGKPTQDIGCVSPLGGGKCI